MATTDGVKLSLNEAARRTGRSKTTLLRWIRSGKLRTLKQDDGTYQIDAVILAACVDNGAASTESAGVDWGEDAALASKFKPEQLAWFRSLAGAFTPEQQAWLAHLGAGLATDDVFGKRLRELLDVLSSEDTFGPRVRPLIEAAAATLPPDERNDPNSLARALLLNVLGSRGSDPPKPEIPDLFRDGYTVVPVNQIVQAFTKAVDDLVDGAKHWTDNHGNTVPTFTHPTNDGRGAVYVSLRKPDGLETPPSSILPELWSKVRSLGRTGDLALDVFFSAIARWASFSAGPKEPVWINADAILDDRGVKRMKSKVDGNPSWQHGHRREDRLAVGKALAQLHDCWLHAVDVETKRRGHGKVNIRNSRVLAMLDIDSQLDLDGQDVFLSARVMPGLWAEVLWEQGLKEIGLLAKQALAYDPFRQRLEKRLARYLATQYRINARYAEPLRLRVSTLLDNGGLEPDRRKPQRTRDRLEKALHQLGEDHVHGSWRYAETGTHTPGPLPARDWLDDWLTAVIVLEVPDRLAERYALIAQQRAALPPPRRRKNS